MTRATVARQMAALALVCAASVVRADYPLPKDNYVNDYAKRLSDSTEQHIRDELASLERDTGVEMTVAVIESVAEYGTGHTAIEPFATGLFNTWGVGNRDKNDGILLLVAVSDRALRIELGSGYSQEADAVAQDIIDREILPHFKTEAYAKGIQAGTEALIAKTRAGALTLHTGLSAMSGDLGNGIQVDARDAKVQVSSRRSISELPAMIRNAYSSVQRIEGLPAAGAGGVVLMLMYSGWRYISRRRPRHCANCHTTMQRLDEVADDQHLIAGERVEENLGSVDYDVWQCPACKATEKVPYNAWFTSYKKCPKCLLRTLKETTQVLREATYSQEGSSRIMGVCRHCHHRTERTESIPQKQRSESRSSGSSSFGGGRSSGGGASGRW